MVRLLADGAAVAPGGRAVEAQVEASAALVAGEDLAAAAAPVAAGDYSLGDKPHKPMG